MFYVGVDGCKSGWFAVRIDDNAKWEVNLFHNVSDLWDKYSDAQLILIDIPIGLKESGPQERLCDYKAREILRHPRAASVFRAACRKAVYDAKTYEEAKAINELMTTKRIPIQTWGIIPKIKEVDKFLLQNSNTRSKIREIHPEVCFWALAKGHPMNFNKKEIQGFSERLELLENIFPPAREIVNYALSNYYRKDVAKDDILDALSAAITAFGGIQNQQLDSIPEIPEYDSKGLRMEMVFLQS